LGEDLVGRFEERFLSLWSDEEGESLVEELHDEK
jgi:hypothetical protein